MPSLSVARPVRRSPRCSLLAALPHCTPRAAAVRSTRCPACCHPLLSPHRLPAGLDCSARCPRPPGLGWSVCIPYHITASSTRPTLPACLSSPCRPHCATPAARSALSTLPSSSSPPASPHPSCQCCSTWRAPLPAVRQPSLPASLHRLAGHRPPHSARGCVSCSPRPQQHPRLGIRRGQARQTARR